MPRFSRMLTTKSTTSVPDSRPMCQNSRSGRCARRFLRIASSEGVSCSGPPFPPFPLRLLLPFYHSLRARSPSLLRSFAYLGADLLLIALLFAFSTRIDTLAPMLTRVFPALPTGPVKAAMWAVYWFFQGAVATGTWKIGPHVVRSLSLAFVLIRSPLTRSLADSRPSGVWVIAHECGHQAFSKYQSVNDGIGLVLHSLLLVPYYSWKFSHARHHSNTGSVAKDEVFVPAIREDKDGAARPFEQFGPLRLVKLIGALTLGWPAVRLMSCS